MAKNQGGGGIGSFLILGGLAGLGLLALHESENAAKTIDVVSVPEADSTEADSQALGSLGDFWSDGKWFQLGTDVQIHIPFPTRSVTVNSTTGKQQFLYNGKWYDGTQLLKVWNPIKKLPSWLRY